jgi:hypothetical protein
MISKYLQKENTPILERSRLGNRLGLHKGEHSLADSPCPKLAARSPAPGDRLVWCIPPPASITFRESATSAARGPASSIASTIRSVNGVGRRAMGNRVATRRQRRGCEWAALTSRRTGARPADKYVHGWGIARVMLGTGNAARYQAFVFNFARTLESIL